MVVLIFFFCHVLCYLVSLTLRFIIYMYIKKKPLGLQSILDPLILDIVRFQVAAYTFFILFALAGITHGQLPFVLSQVIIVINNSTNNFVYGLFLYFLVVKALVVFKENWIQEVSDSTNVRVSRVVAFFVAWLRLYGDICVQEPGPGVMTKFLTGTDHQTYLRVGPFQTLLVVTLLIGIVLYQVTKPCLSTEEAKEEKKMMLAALPWSILLVIAFISLQVIIKEDQVGRFLLTSLLIASVQQIIPFYFILTHPKLKFFANGIFKSNQVLPL